MSSKPFEVQVLAVFDYWDAYVGGEKKSKQMDLNDTPKSMSFPLMTYLSEIVVV